MIAMIIFFNNLFLNLFYLYFLPSCMQCLFFLTGCIEEKFDMERKKITLLRNSKRLRIIMEGEGRFGQWLPNHKWGNYYIYLCYLKKKLYFLLNQNYYVIKGEWVDQWLRMITEEDRGKKIDYIIWEWYLILYLNTPIRFL